MRHDELIEMINDLDNGSKKLDEVYKAYAALLAELNELVAEVGTLRAALQKVTP